MVVIDMRIRPYFLLGDVLANVCVGALIAWVMSAFVSPAWPMLVAMIVSMFLGMFLSLIVGLVLFFRFFGAMEVMLPTMFSGMLSGMCVGMAASMVPVATGTALWAGALIGLVTVIAIYGANYLINGRLPA
jgi:hypothetical protein